MAGRALVLGDDFGIFLAVARSLGRRGIEVHVAPADFAAPGLASRYVAAVHTLPPYHRDPAAWVGALRVLVDVHGYRLVVPCDDSRLALLRRHGAEIGRDRLAIPNEAALAAFADKAATRAAALRAGVPVAPGRLLAEEDEPAALAAELGLPLVLKPRVSYAPGDPGDKTFACIVRGPSALAQALEAARGRDWLAESWVPGVGVGLSVLASRGEILLAWQHRRLRVRHETGGSTARIAERIDPRLLADAGALARATALTGVAMFEFRADRAGGAHALIEVNPRFWGSLPLALACGADFPALLWDLLTGAGVEIPAAAPGLLAGRSLTGEYERLVRRVEQAPSRPARLGAGAALLGFAATLAAGRPGRRGADSWAADDPQPWRLERRRLLARLAGAMLSRLRPRQSPQEALSAAR